MKNLKLISILTILLLTNGFNSYSQFSGWKEKALEVGASLGAKKTGT